jgi:hypothetical protein
MKKIFILIFGVITLAGNAQDSITSIEWWIDNDYTTRHIQAIDPSQTIEGRFSLDLSAVPAGNHLFFLRFKDNKGQWSPLITRHISKTPNGDSGVFVSGCEYWINDDYHSKKNLVLNHPASMVDTTIGMDLSTFPDGAHVLSFRFYDNMGDFSPVFRRYIRKYPVGNDKNLVTAYRYWFNDSMETMQQVAFDTPGKLLEPTIVIPVEGFKVGDTVLINMQFLDLIGGWSGIIADTFRISKKTSITTYAGNSGNMIVYPNPAKSVVNIEILQNNGVSTPLEIILYDAVGKTLIKRRIENHYRSPIFLNINELPRGVYYISADDGHQTYKKKIIKE